MKLKERNQDKLSLFHAFMRYHEIGIAQNKRGKKDYIDIEWPGPLMYLTRTISPVRVLNQMNFSQKLARRPRKFARTGNIVKIRLIDKILRLCHVQGGDAQARQDASKLFNRFPKNSA